MTNKLKNISVGDTVIVTKVTQDGIDVYEGDVLAINEERLIMTYFNGVKDELREVEIPMNKIQSIEMDY